MFGTGAGARAGTLAGTQGGTYDNLYMKLRAIASVDTASMGGSSGCRGIARFAEASLLGMKGINNILNAGTRRCPCAAGYHGRDSCGWKRKQSRQDMARRSEQLHCEEGLLSDGCPYSPRNLRA